MAYYDEQGFSQMQRDALERMRDMQRRSKSLVFESPLQSEPTKEDPSPKNVTENSFCEAKPEHCPTHCSQPKKNDLMSSLFSGGSGIDSEKLLILLILFVLYKNKADIKLLIALGYLLI